MFLLQKYHLIEFLEVSSLKCYNKTNTISTFCLKIMENNQENLPPIIPSQPLKSLDKKLTVLVIIVLTGLALVYIIYPKNITSCGVLPNGPSCAKYVCLGIPVQGTGKPLCLGKLRLVGHTTPPQQNQTQDISEDWKTYKVGSEEIALQN